MVCQSLQAVAAFLKFDWNEGTPYRELFRTRLFDFWGKLDPPAATRRSPGSAAGTPAAPASTARSRWSTPTPPGASCRWPPLRGKDDLAPYRHATPDLLRGFQARRLEAMERVAKDFRGNKQTEKTPFELPDLAVFEEKARTLAHALHEFVTIERHVELATWKRERLAPPERRVLPGRRCSSATWKRTRSRGSPSRTARTSAADASKRRSAPPTARHTRTQRSCSSHQGRARRSPTGRRRGCGSGCAWSAPTSTATSTRSSASPR